MENLLKGLRQSFDTVEAFDSYCEKYGLNKLNRNGIAVCKQIEPRKGSKKDFKLVRCQICSGTYVEYLTIYESDGISHLIINEVKGNLYKMKWEKFKNIITKYCKIIFKSIILVIIKFNECLMKLKLRWIVLIFLTVWIGIMFFDISDLKKDRSKIELDKASIESRVSELEDRLRNDELAMLLMDAHRPVKSNPSDSIVWDYIKNSPAWYPEIVMAQYVIESGHGKSKLSKEFNNYFGMKLTSKSSRMTTQIPKLSGFREYGVYSNWKMSVIDRLLWDWFVFESIPTKEDYINKLCAIYVEDPNYKSIITKESKNWK